MQNRIPAFFSRLRHSTSGHATLLTALSTPMLIAVDEDEDGAITIGGNGGSGGGGGGGGFRICVFGICINF